MGFESESLALRTEAINGRTVPLSASLPLLKGRWESGVGIRIPGGGHWWQGVNQGLVRRRLATRLIWPSISIFGSSVISFRARTSIIAAFQNFRRSSLLRKNSDRQSR